MPPIFVTYVRGGTRDKIQHVLLLLEPPSLLPVLLLPCPILSCKTIQLSGNTNSEPVMPIWWSWYIDFLTLCNNSITLWRGNVFLFCSAQIKMWVLGNFVSREQMKFDYPIASRPASLRLSSKSSPSINDRQVHYEDASIVVYRESSQCHQEHWPEDSEMMCKPALKLADK